MASNFPNFSFSAIRNKKKKTEAKTATISKHFDFAHVARPRQSEPYRLLDIHNALYTPAPKPQVPIPPPPPLSLAAAFPPVPSRSTYMPQLHVGARSLPAPQQLHLPHRAITNAKDYQRQPPLRPAPQPPLPPAALPLALPPAQPALHTFNAARKNYTKNIVETLRHLPIVDKRTLALVNLADMYCSGARGFDNGNWIQVTFRLIDDEFKDAILEIGMRGMYFLFLSFNFSTIPDWI